MTNQTLEGTEDLKSFLLLFWKGHNPVGKNELADRIGDMLEHPTEPSRYLPGLNNLEVCQLLPDKAGGCLLELIRIHDEDTRKEAFDWDKVWQEFVRDHRSKLDSPSN